MDNISELKNLDQVYVLKNSLFVSVPPPRNGIEWKDIENWNHLDFRSGS